MTSALSWVNVTRICVRRITVLLWRSVSTCLLKKRQKRSISVRTSALLIALLCHFRRLDVNVIRLVCRCAGIVFTLWSGRPARSSAMPVLFLLCGPAGLHEVQLCRYYTYIQMQRLKWHCHSTVAGALYKIIVSNSCSAVYRRKTHETVSSSIPGGTAATMERPWQTTAGHSRHMPLPPGRRGHQVWRAALAAQPVSTWQQTGVADVHRRQQTSEGSQRGMKVQCHWDSDAPEHIAETEFSPELVTSVVHGGVELCVLTSSLRTPSEQRRSRQTVVAAKVRRKFRPALNCSSLPYWPPVHEPRSHYHVSSAYGVKSNYIFGIVNYDLLIHYTTFNLL